LTLESEIFVLAARPEEISHRAWLRLMALLDESERLRAERFVFEQHQRAFVAAHALKRLMLAAATGVPATAWTFETGAGGKPRVTPHRGLRPFFNLSHCEGLVACAVSLDIELGVDLEPLDRAAPLAIAETHYGHEERLWLNALPLAEQQTGFYALWTLKEAFLKAVGVGLAHPMKNIAFAFDPLRVNFRNLPSDELRFGEADAWHFEQCRVSTGHLLALAWRGGPARVHIRTVSLEELLEQSGGDATRGADVPAAR
jgi:4'-phosphopantetheinyl transferase